VSDGHHGDEIARLALMLVLTLKGTPFLYYGEEIGMTDLLLDDISQFRDLWGRWNYHALQEQQGLPADEALRMAAHFSRDRCRTPMQWSSAANGGFCPAGVTPWLPVNANHRAGINVAEQEQSPRSLLSFYRSLLAVRRATPALVAGEYRSLQPTDQDQLTFIRHSCGQRCLVALNLSDKTTRLAPSSELPAAGNVLFSTNPRHNDVPISLPNLPIEPFEGLIVSLEQE
jgi:alpha-glucosidase